MSADLTLFSYNINSTAAVHCRS